jgi:hypothetical protein
MDSIRDYGYPGFDANNAAHIFDRLPLRRLRNLSRSMEKGRLIDFDRVSVYLRVIHQVGQNVDHALRVCAPLAWRIEIKFKEMIPHLKSLIEKHGLSKFEWIRIGEDASRALCCTPVGRFYAGSIPDTRFAVTPLFGDEIGFCVAMESGLARYYTNHIETKWLAQIDWFLYMIRLYDRIISGLLDNFNALPTFRCACGVCLETDSLHDDCDKWKTKNYSNDCEFKIGDSRVWVVMGFVWLRVTVNPPNNNSRYFETACNDHGSSPEFSVVEWSEEHQGVHLLPLIVGEEGWIASITEFCLEAVTRQPEK